MVGELRDKMQMFGGHAGASGRTQALPAEPRPPIRIDLTREQFDAVVGQWSVSTRNLPTDVVVAVDSEPVGVLHVIASHFVDPSAT